MAKKSRDSKSGKQATKKVMTERKGDVAFVKSQIRQLPGWPNVQVKDWMGIVVRHYRLEANLTTKDPLYQTFKRHVANAKSYEVAKARQRQKDG